MGGEGRGRGEGSGRGEGVGGQADGDTGLVEGFLGVDNITIRRIAIEERQIAVVGRQIAVDSCGELCGKNLQIP